MIVYWILGGVFFIAVCFDALLNNPRWPETTEMLFCLKKGIIYIIAFPFLILFILCKCIEACFPIVFILVLVLIGFLGNQ